ncbi:MAG: hypothetical protein AAGI88_19110 [Pseudomonadota bacterium]
MKRLVLSTLVAAPILLLSLQQSRAAEPTTHSTFCEAPGAAFLSSLIGEWALELEADEGWTGYGKSTISWDYSRVCSVLDTQVAVFNQESDSPFENKSTHLISADSLSGTLKLLSSDRRGYTHLGISGQESGNEDLAFEIIRPGGGTPTRRILYRSVKPESFEWVWQGLVEDEESWVDRLVITYVRE